MHILHPLAVLRAGGDDINAGRIDAAVTENVGELCNVLFDAVKHPGEQVAQIVRKHLFRVDLRLLAQGFHLPPDICPVDGLARAGHENHPAFDPLLRRIAEQFLFQRLYDKNCPSLRLAVHHRFSAPDRFHGDIPQLADPDAGSADGLQDQAEPPIVPALRRPDQAGVFLPGQFLFFGAVDLLLQFQHFHLQIVPAQKGEQTVETGQHGIDAPHGAAPLQVLFVPDHRFLCDCSIPHICRKSRGIPDIFFHRLILSQKCENKNWRRFSLRYPEHLLDGTRNFSCRERADQIAA